MSTTDSFGREYSERPWGSYTVLDDTASNYKVKQITVTPGKRLSYQTHKCRSEHWFIVSGHATVVLDGATIELDAGGSVDIHVGQAHRCENMGSDPVVFIEIQTGTYFGEDDIVRLEDDFGRTS
jgi:mannose-6-phosphate isomerase